MWIAQLLFPLKIVVWITVLTCLLRPSWAVCCSFSADLAFEPTEDVEPVETASSSMIQHVTVPALNQAFEVIGETPLNPKRLKLQGYGKRKLEQLQTGVRQTLQMPEPKDNFEEMLSQWRKKFASQHEVKKSSSWRYYQEVGVLDKSNTNFK